MTSGQVPKLEDQEPELTDLTLGSYTALRLASLYQSVMH